jgi:hypothetical protein
VLCVVCCVGVSRSGAEAGCVWGVCEGGGWAVRGWGAEGLGQSVGRYRGLRVERQQLHNCEVSKDLRTRKGGGNSGAPNQDHGAPAACGFV